MATTPTPVPASTDAPALKMPVIGVTISDPVLATINNGFTAVTAFCQLAQTPVGQQMLQKFLNDAETLEAFVSRLANALADGFGKLFHHGS